MLPKYMALVDSKLVIFCVNLKLISQLNLDLNFILSLRGVAPSSSGKLYMSVLYSTRLTQLYGEFRGKSTSQLENRSLGYNVSGLLLWLDGLDLIK